MTYSLLSHLECSKCGKIHDAHILQNVCSCGSPLLARYDLEQAVRTMHPEAVERREANLWRYHELLPVQHVENVVTLGEGMTPLLALSTIGTAYGMPRLLLKDEGIIPTGSLKARGAAVGVSRAKELGVCTIAMPTTGNAGAAWAIYGARAGLQTCIVMPENAPSIMQSECTASGADLYLVRGLISDAGNLVAAGVSDFGWFDASTMKEPYRLEGMKTMGFELAEQLHWKVPDVILYPTGGGVGLIGIYKALQELQALGWIDSSKMPRLVAVQASGCAPIVKAWEARQLRAEFWESAETVAIAITEPQALGDFLVLRAIYETDGCAIAVDDVDILDWQQRLARQEGLFICPEGAATAAAAVQLRESGWIRETDNVVLLNTGTGLKYPNTFATSGLPLFNPGDRLPESAVRG